MDDERQALRRMDAYMWIKRNKHLKTWIYGIRITQTIVGKLDEHINKETGE